MLGVLKRRRGRVGILHYGPDIWGLYVGCMWDMGYTRLYGGYMGAICWLYEG